MAALPLILTRREVGEAQCRNYRAIDHSSFFVCGRADDNTDSLPLQCGYFVSPTGILTTAHELPSTASKGAKITAYIRRSPGLDSLLDTLITYFEVLLDLILH